MKTTIEFAPNTLATINDGKWECADPKLLAMIKKVSAGVDDSPSIPDIDYRRAVVVADLLGGLVITKAPAATGGADLVH
jgi:hypothetical protein